MMRAMDRIGKGIEIVTVIGCAAMTLIVVSSAMLRYILGEGMGFSEDLSRYLMVYVVFLGAALVLREDGHIGIQVLLNKFRERPRTWLVLLSHLLVLVFLAIVGYQSGKILPAQFRVRIVTMPGVPLGLFYVAVPLGCLFMALFLIPKILQAVRKLTSVDNHFRWMETFPALVFLGIMLTILLLLFGDVSDGQILILLLVGFFTLVFLGVPVAFSLGLCGLCFFVMLPQAPLLAVPTLIFGGVSPFTLLAIPLFILTGLLMERSGILESLVKFSDAFVGHFPGGLAHVTILGSMFFASVCGVALAASAAIGAMMIPLMIRQGYGRRFSAAVTSSAAIIGPIIPPSVGMIIYSNATGGKVSVGGMFLTGVIPGVVLGIGMMTMTWFFARKRNYPVNENRFSPRAVWVSGVSALPGLVVPVIILFGIVFGLFTPGEVGGITAVYALILGVFVTRRLGWKDLMHCLLETSKITAVVFMLLAGAKLVGFLLSIFQAPVRLADMLQGLTTNPYIFIALTMGALVLIGFVLEAVATMVMLVPILAPAASSYGIDPYHFGLIVVMTVQLALITPPVALGLFIVSRLADTTIEEVIRDAWPFVVLIYALILLMAFFPQLTLWLPKLAGYIE